MTASRPSWVEIISEPEMSQWPGLLRQSTEFPEELGELRQSARQRLIEAAQQYVLRLATAAGQAGLQLEPSGVLTGDPERQPIVLTGHQPVIFHGGLTWKYFATEQLAAAESAIGIAVSIDTDVGDPGSLRIPRHADPAEIDTEEGITQAEVSFTSGETLLGSASFLPAAELDAMVRTTQSQLQGVVANDVCDRWMKVAEDYLRLAAAGLRPAEANSIVRWKHGIGSRLLELPLSAICCFPEVVDLIAAILDQAEGFAAEYNNGLQTFRRSHNIRNEANPFPDLTDSGDALELPFWVIDSSKQTRQRLFLRRMGDHTQLLAEETVVATITAAESTCEVLESLPLRDIQFIPRGALITSFLRLLFADLFIHGTSGGRYDRFTDEFAVTWWRVKLPPFAVTSASQYLFADRRKELKQLESLQKQLRDLMYNPQRHFGSGVFSSELEGKLQKLVGRKAGWIQELKSAHARGKSAKDLGHQIQLVTDEMRTLVSSEFEPKLAALTAVTPDTRAAVECRTYPWFLCD